MMEVGRDLREGAGELFANLVRVFRSPENFMEMVRNGRAHRRDAGIQMRLNRTLRKQFIEAFNNSARGQLSVDTDRTLRGYRMRNRISSVLLRPYEMFSLFNLPAKIVTASLFFKGSRMLALPVMGIWSVAVPLGAMIGSRMGLVYRDAKNKQQEAELASAGFIVPARMEVRDDKVSVQGHEIAQDFVSGFPILNKKTPEWIVSSYDSRQKIFGVSEKLHAAGFEALRTKRLTTEDVSAVRYGVANRALQGCAYAFALIFPEMNAQEALRSVKFMADEKLPLVDAGAGLTSGFRRAAQLPQEAGYAPLPEIILKAIEPFCLRGAEDQGLSALAGKISMNELRDLAKLYSLGVALDAGKARNVLRMMDDARFSENLRFGQMIEIALWPDKTSALFDNLWKDRDYRPLGYDMLKEFVVHADGWGNVALRLMRHDYVRQLSGENIRELALPENAHWAHVYHDLRLTCPDAANVPHNDLRGMVQEFGLNAVEKLAQKPVPSHVARFG